MINIGCQTNPTKDTMIRQKTKDFNDFHTKDFNDFHTKKVS